MATKIQAPAKSGKTLDVLVIESAEVSSDPEARAYQAADLAQTAGCTHWRIMGVLPSGAPYVAQTGKASAPLLSYEQAAAQSGPKSERHDW